jgi:hypothetical protein
MVIDSVTGQTIEITPQGNSTISFWNSTHTDRAFLNAPSGNSFGVNGFQYTSTIAPGNPVVRPRLFMVNGGTFLETVDSGQVHVGSSVALQDGALQLSYYDSNHNTDSYLQLGPTIIKMGSDFSAKTLSIDTTAGMNMWVDVWHNINPGNSWGIVVQPQYMIMPDGQVIMRGIISSGNLSNATIIFAFPASYAPNVEANLHCTADNAPNNIFKMATNGNMSIFNCTSGNYYLECLTWSTLSR